jgi:hypothetical protein
VFSSINGSTFETVRSQGQQLSVPDGQLSSSLSLFEGSGFRSSVPDGQLSSSLSPSVGISSPELDSKSLRVVQQVIRPPSPTPAMPALVGVKIKFKRCRAGLRQELV